jgi:hypothetical protein
VSLLHPVPDFHGSETKAGEQDPAAAVLACIDGVTSDERDLCRNFGDIR